MGREMCHLVTSMVVILMSSSVYNYLCVNIDRWTSFGQLWTTLDNIGQLDMSSCCYGQVPGHQVPAAVQGAGQVVGQAANSEGRHWAGNQNIKIFTLFIIYSHWHWLTIRTLLLLLLGAKVSRLPLILRLIMYYENIQWNKTMKLLN